jgi:hypothetical protein
VFLEYGQCMAGYHDVCTCIVTVLELISIQVMASGTESGLGFSCSLA